MVRISIPSSHGRLRAVAAVIALAAGAVLGPAAAASAEDTFTPIRDFLSPRGDYGVHLSRNDTNGLLRAVAFNNTAAAHSFGVGTDGTVRGQVEPLWDDGLAGFSSAFQTTLQGSGRQESDLPTLAGMSYAFYADLPTAPGDAPAQLLGTHVEPGHWMPLAFDADASGEVRSIDTGFPVALSLPRINAGGALRVDVARTGDLTSGEVRAVPSSALRSGIDDGGTLAWSEYGAGLRRFDPASSRVLAPAAVVNGAIHQQVLIPADLPPGDYDIVVGDPTSGWWPVGVTSWVEDHNLTVLPAGATATGTDVQTQLSASGEAVTVTFGTVTAPGTTTLSASSTPAGAGVPPGTDQTGFSFLSTDQPVYYALESTAGWAPPAIVCFAGSAGDHLWHFDADVGQWVDITLATQPTAGMICGRTESFSPFAVAKPFTFLAPVGNAVLNVAQAGSSIPLKFSGWDKGLGILAAGYPKSGTNACGSAPVDPVESTAAPGATGLSYDAKTSTYTYVWKTDRAWRNTCRDLVLKLADGSSQRATFQFK